ncbi:MAG: hypothetical protein DHS20C21_21900 [Gemmatimonadota bacterium]|nr:MAG: hypothetical protein DHS20C21_21900 [Gemmatimonadota bacterium]
MKMSRCLLAVTLVLSPTLTASADSPALQPYGFVRLDGILNDSPMNSAQSPGWVLSEVANPTDPDQVAKDQGEINIHPRLTRFGVNIAKTTVGNDVSIAGKIEADFQNGGSESRQAVRMRHGYFTVSRGVWEVLAGQTWDVISPLYPFVNHDSMMWNSGNPGDRRPQLRFSLRPQVGEGNARIAVAVATPNAINNRDLDGNGIRDGSYAMLPAMQGLAELDLSAILIGVSGHFHRDRVVVDTGTALAESDFDATLLAGHVKIPVGKRLTVIGEAFTAQNADDVRAGIGQGINQALNKEIRTVGGWGEIRVQLNQRWSVAAGGSVDNPKDADLSDGMRTKNQAAYGGLGLRALDRVQVGLEFIHWKTDYVNAPDGDANRVDLWGRMSF